MSTNVELQELRELNHKVDRLLSLVAAQPNLTQKAFAKRSGLSRSTVQRRCASGEIRTDREGRVLFAELAKFTS